MPELGAYRLQLCEPLVTPRHRAAAHDGSLRRVDELSAALDAAQAELERSEVALKRTEREISALRAAVAELNTVIAAWAANVSASEALAKIAIQEHPAATKESAQADASQREEALRERLAAMRAALRESNEARRRAARHADGGMHTQIAAARQVSWELLNAWQTDFRPTPEHHEVAAGGRWRHILQLLRIRAARHPARN